MDQQTGATGKDEEGKPLKMMRYHDAHCAAALTIHPRMNLTLTVCFLSHHPLFAREPSQIANGLVRKTVARTTASA